MTIKSIKDKLVADGIFYAEDKINGYPTVIGYEKKFSWSWAATQLSTLVIVSDYGDQEISVRVLERHIYASLEYAKKHYGNRLKRMFSSFAVIPVIISDQVSEEAKVYCQKSKARLNKTAITVPVILDRQSNEAIYFTRYPLFSIIYYPHFKRLINRLV